MASLRRLTTAALDLAFPAACAGCGREGPPLCPACLPALDARLALPGGTPIGLPADIPAPLLQIEWCAPFTGPVRDATRPKVQGRASLSQALRGRDRAAVGRESALRGGGGRAGSRPRRPRTAAQLRPGGAHRGRSLRAGSVCVGARSSAKRADRSVQAQARRAAANVTGAFRIRRGGAGARAIAGRWVLLVDDVV